MNRKPAVETKTKDKKAAQIRPFGAEGTTREMRMGILMTVFVSYCFAWQNIFTKLIQAQGVRTLDVITMLFVVGAVIAHAFVLATGKRREVYGQVKGNGKVVLFMGAVNFGVSVGFFYALETLPAGVVTAVGYSAPAMVVVFYLITRIKPIPLAGKVAVLVSIAGVALALNVFGGPVGNLSVSGIGWALFGALCYGAYAVGAELLVPKGMKQLTVVTFGLTVSALIGALINPGMFLRFPHIGAIALLFLLLNATITKFVPLQLEVKASSIIGAERVMVILCLNVPFSILNAYLVLGETLKTVQLLGAGLILAAVLMIQKK